MTETQTSITRWATDTFGTTTAAFAGARCLEEVAELFGSKALWLAAKPIRRRWWQFWRPTERDIARAIRNHLSSVKAGVENGASGRTERGSIDEALQLPGDSEKGAWMKNLSCQKTWPQVEARIKDVTRRLGWWDHSKDAPRIQPGDRLRLVPKVMGFRKGEKMDISGPVVEVVSVRREPLNRITQEDVRREGFSEWTSEEFVAFFCEAFKCRPDALVTRIEWRWTGGSAG